MATHNQEFTGRKIELQACGIDPRAPREPQSSRGAPDPNVRSSLLGGPGALGRALGLGHAGRDPREIALLLVRVRLGVSTV